MNLGKIMEQAGIDVKSSERAVFVRVRENHGRAKVFGPLPEWDARRMRNVTAVTSEVKDAFKGIRSQPKGR